jgi:hypothetical protein
VKQVAQGHLSDNGTKRTSRGLRCHVKTKSVAARTRHAHEGPHRGDRTVVDAGKYRPTAGQSRSQEPFRVHGHFEHARALTSDLHRNRKAADEPPVHELSSVGGPSLARQRRTRTYAACLARRYRPPRDQLFRLSHRTEFHAPRSGKLQKHSWPRAMGCRSIVDGLGRKVFGPNLPAVEGRQSERRAGSRVIAGAHCKGRSRRMGMESRRRP